MYVDGKKFQTYILDSRESIKDRISLSLKIPKEYIIFSFEGENVTTNSIFQIIGKYRSDDIEGFYKFLKESKNDSFRNINLETAFGFWYVYRLNEKIDPSVEYKIEKFLQDNKTSFSRIKNSTEFFKKTIREKLKEAGRKTDEIIKGSNLLESQKEYYTTDIDIVKTKLEISFNVDYDVYELFNSLELSKDVPFSVIKEFYKIFKEFSPSDKWTYSREKLENDFKDKSDVLYLKVLSIRNEPIKINHSLYSTVSIFFEKIKSDDRRAGDDQGEKKEENKGKEKDVNVNLNKVVIRVDSNVGSEFTENDLIRRILSTFPNSKDIVVLEKKQIQIKAESFVPKFVMDRPVFLDLVMNDPLFYRMCSIDERMTIQRKKGGIYLYFYFDPNDFDDNVLTCSITEQTVEKTNLKLIAKDPKLKVDTSYLKVRITKAQDKEKANVLKSIFGRLLSLYQKKKKEIISIYNFYIDDLDKILSSMREEIQTKRKKSTRTKQLLKDIDPGLFTSDYSRWMCPSIRSLKIISNKENPEDPEPPEIVEMEEKNIQTMLFPKNKVEDGKTYNQYYYSCNHHKYDKYPGLRYNKLSNKDKFPIVPCCYKIDHRNKKKSIWKLYYEEGKDFKYFKSKNKDEAEEEDEKHYYTTNKILPPRRYGVLVKNVERFFNIIDGSSKYIRQGVNRSYNSVIESLMMALDPDFDGYINSLENEVNKIRKKLSELSQTSDVYQQAYNYNPETVKLYLEDYKKYLDPKLFIRLLEDYFKCYIFIFSQTEENPLGFLNCPTHVKEYLQRNKEPERKTIFIYEHFGSDLDKSEYPQCELIVKDKDKEAIFSNDEEVVIRTNEIFREMYLTRENDDKIDVYFKTKVKSQEIDYNGKTRKLQSENFNELCIITDPLPPLKLPQGCKYKQASFEDARRFLDEEKITSYKEHIVSNKRVGIQSKKGDVTFYIPLIPSHSDNQNEVDKIFPSGIIKNSELSSYNNFHRIARYITEYMLYLFSLDFKRKNPKVIDSEYILDFVKENIEIDDDFEYKQVPRMFSLRDSGVIRNKKLILKNTVILKKLLYVLKLRLKTDIEDVKNYSEYKYIQTYYADVKDFTQHENQPILFGQLALRKWIESKKPIYPLFDSVQHRDKSLLSELQKYDTNKLFVLVFYANWHRPSKSLLNKIYKTRTTFKNKKSVDLVTKYSNHVNFIYVNIDKNKGLASTYNVESIPYIYFMKVNFGVLSEVSTIKCGENDYECAKLIEKEIIKILDIK